MPGKMGKTQLSTTQRLIAYSAMAVGTLAIVCAFGSSIYITFCVISLSLGIHVVLLYNLILIKVSISGNDALAKEVHDYLSISDLPIGQYYIEYNLHQIELEYLRFILEFKEGQSLVISSTGPSLRLQLAWCFGVFDYNSTIGVFQQRADITIKDDHRYLSQSNSTNMWYVSKPWGKSGGWLKNTDTSSIVPTTGWQYWNENAYSKDNTITIQAGDIVPCSAVTIEVGGGAAEKWPTCCNGVFRFNNQWVWGRPVYYNEDGHALYLDGFGKWLVGLMNGKYWLKSNSGPLHPIDTVFWDYADEDVAYDIAAQVKISCMTLVNIYFYL